MEVLLSDTAGGSSAANVIAAGEVEWEWDKLTSASYLKSDR